MSEIVRWFAHANPALIAGYLGKGESIDLALSAFATAYADQTERDYAAMLKALRAGRIQASANVQAMSD